jgi:hypothetical protein
MRDWLGQEGRELLVTSHLCGHWLEYSMPGTPDRFPRAYLFAERIGDLPCPFCGGETGHGPPPGVETLAFDALTLQLPASLEPGGVVYVRRAPPGRALFPRPPGMTLAELTRKVRSRKGKG